MKMSQLKSMITQTCQKKNRLDFITKHCNHFALERVMYVKTIPVHLYIIPQSTDHVIIKLVTLLLAWKYFKIMVYYIHRYCGT